MRGKSLAELRSAIADTIFDWVRDRLAGPIPAPEQPLQTLTDAQLAELKSISFLPDSIRTLAPGVLRALTDNEILDKLPSGFSFEAECLRKISGELAAALREDLLDELKNPTVADKGAIPDVTNRFSDEIIPPDTSPVKPLAVKAKRDAVRAAHVLLTLAFRARSSTI